MRLRTGLRVLWRAPDEVQVGTDARWAVRLTGLTPGEVELLLALGGDTDARQLAGRARLLGVPAQRWDALLAELTHAQLTTPPGSQAPASAAQVPARLGPDALTWGRVLHDGDGDALVAGRRARVVGLVGAGRTGLVIAGTLAAAGVGAVLVEDDRPVAPGDLGVGGYATRDLGSPRKAAAARVLRDLAPDVRTNGPERTRPDVMVLVEHGAADALRARVLMSAAVAHLSVVVREADVVVGPLVRPGTSACLRCLDLGRTDLDPRWPALAAQLAGGRSGLAPHEETVLAAAAGALAAGQVLAQLDGTTPGTLGACLEIALPDAIPRLRRWAVHPECGCTGLPLPRDR
ncbi:ThiF family adenylyltransferase [Pengzhenrongella sicca]|uniref:ThiF family adenylyltransferase n=1 Tax=Pengzhenrongella sicca TaxID=2819238 RepID=A0A8A4ZG96_9MICO|nr:ThiF family adenylyltransferase [Pengzhenrongella sicca]QTE30019.1 ThiF family adenylyltransferase [Pengzhenrongella sicca]